MALHGSAAVILCRTRQNSYPKGMLSRSFLDLAVNSGSEMSPEIGHLCTSWKKCATLRGVNQLILLLFYNL